MLARVSMMLGQTSGPVPPPLPPKPWLDDAHRSIATHYFSEPGPLGLKVRGVQGSDAPWWQVQLSACDECFADLNAATVLTC